MSKIRVCMLTKYGARCGGGGTACMVNAIQQDPISGSCWCTISSSQRPSGWAVQSFIREEQQEVGCLVCYLCRGKKKKKAFGYFPILFCSQTAVFALGKQIILALLVTVRKRWTEQCRRISLSSDQELPELAFPWKCYRAKSFVRITDRLLLLSVIDFSSVLLCARG